MSPERFRLVDELLAAALARSATERPAFLAAECGDDAELRREVEELLAHDETEDFLDRPIVTDSDLGRRIGPYRTVRLLGRGGMGAVYQAVREDDYAQKVALKLVKRGMDSDEIVRRFLAERQILAGLDHPNVARILDGGTAEDGRPYFVMELIEGEPIDRYCDSLRLDLRGRLELFLAVCAAVEEAHRRLVVHCDLKPGNILVDATGAPKLLDFGIAKLLRGDHVDATLVTAPGMRPLTPRWASPEQLRGERLTTASDVYSLGVVLFQLLTGHLPLRLDGGDPVRTVCEDEPPRPSTAVRRTEEHRRADGSVETVTPEAVSRVRGTDPPRLWRQLTGDLDAIVLKAIRKEPDARYGSVHQLAEDVRRHLEGRPVAARAGTFTYRAGKFVRRHRLGLVVAVAFLALVAGFIAVLGRQLARTEQVQASLVQVLRALYPSQGESERLAIKDALDESAAIIRDRMSGQSLAQAEMLDVVGRAYAKHGFYDDARPLLEEALALRRSELAGDHPLVAESLHNLAFFFEAIGDDESAEPLLQQSLAIENRRLAADPTPEVQLQLAAGLNNLGLLLQRRGELEAAEDALRRCLELRSPLLPADDLDLARSRANLAEVLMEKGDHAAAEAIYREILALRREHQGPDHEELARSLNQVGTALFARGAFAEAEDYFRESLAMRRRLLGDRHPSLAVVLNNLGRTLFAGGRAAEAEEMLREALDLVVSAYGDKHLHVAATRRNLAAVLATRDPAAGEVLARQALEYFRGELGVDSWRVADAESALGACLAGERRDREAEPLLVDAYCRLLAVRGADDTYPREAWQRIVALDAARGRPPRDQAAACPAVAPAPASPGS